MDFTKWQSPKVHKHATSKPKTHFITLWADTKKWLVITKLTQQLLASFSKNIIYCSHCKNQSVQPPVPSAIYFFNDLQRSPCNWSAWLQNENLVFRKLSRGQKRPTRKLAVGLTLRLQRRAAGNCRVPEISSTAFFYHCFETSNSMSLHLRCLAVRKDTPDTQLVRQKDTTRWSLQHKQYAVTVTVSCGQKRHTRYRSDHTKRPKHVPGFTLGK